MIAIVLAAGKGERFDSNVPKQFAKINGKEIIRITVERMLKLNPEVIIVTAPKRYLEKIKKLFEDINGVRILEGGETRADSVSKALEFVRENDEIVLIHDGVRPAFPVRQTLECIENAKRYGSSTLAVPVRYTIARVIDEYTVSYPDRKELWEIQTPQCFKAYLIKKAHELLKADNFVPTDDTSLMLRYKLSRVRITVGTDYNIKITYPSDISVVETILEEMKY